MGYIFGGSTGETPESLKRKREVAEALLRRGASAMPQNLPEGIVAVAQALSGRIGINALDKQEAAGRAKSDASFDEWYKANMPSREISGTSGADALPAGEGGDYFANIRAAESGGNPNAKNPLSSATGLYQWTDGTWAEMMRKHPELGLTADGRGNPDQEEKAIRAFTAGNADVLKSAGIEPTGGNLYAAHFLGAGGARNVLSQPDDASVASLVGPEVVKANPFLQGMSVGDFRRWAASKGGNDVLPGGEGEDMLADAWSKPDPNRPGHGIDTRTGTPSSFSEPDPERFGPTTAPKGDRLAQAFQAQPPLTPEGVTVPTMIGDEKPAPRPTPRPQPQMQPDPMQTAAVQPPAMQPRGIVSPRAEDNGYTRGPGAAPSNMSPQQAVAGALMRRQAAAGAPPVGNAPAGPAGGIPGISPSTAAMLSDPNLSEGQRAVVLSVLKQQMDANDPTAQAELDYTRARTEKLRQEATGVGGPAEYGLNPQTGVDDQGNPVLIQVGKDGKAVRTAMPDGVTLSKTPIKIDAGTEWIILDPVTRQPVKSIPKDIAGAAAQDEIGTAQGKAAGAAPGDIQAAQNALDIVDSLRTDPNRERGTGWSATFNVVPGTKGYDYQNKVDQAKSGAFLTAIQQMRGLGALSNAEGSAATQAITRMSTATSEEAFMSALDDYEKIVRQGMERAQRTGRKFGTVDQEPAPAAAEDPLGIR